MILFLGRYLIGVLECHQTGKNRKSRLAIICCAIPIAIVAPVQLRPEKKMICYYNQKKKRSSRLSGGCAIVITTGKKNFSRLSGGCAIVIKTGKKKF